MHKLRVAFSGGGTGGHIYPLIAVATETQILAAEEHLEIDMRYFGSPKQYRETLEENGVSISSITESKIRRYFDLRNLIDIPKFVFSLIQALWGLYWFMPDVVFSKGGPGAMAVVLAAAFYKIPIYVHESDSRPSLTSLSSARFANKIFLAFKEAAPYFSGTDGQKIVFSGNPLRRQLFTNLMASDSAKTFFGFDRNLPLVVVMGGSQGSTRINDFVLLSLPRLLQKYQVLHQVGDNNYDEYESEVAPILSGLPYEIQQRYRFTPFFKSELKDVMTAADLIVSRSGSALFEIAAFGKPSILIPLPEAASNHQEENAKVYAASGACDIMTEKDFSPETFLMKVENIVDNPDVREQMAAQARLFGKRDAALIISQEIVKLANNDQG
ncbi:MAG: UDP-N-acetylglucosamine--N-acetylmuramyl-(pentapeptide) pyrophosphoryl-undecaprenol N-acetylglucosamine transferase [Patescibacteria group bacterium]|nr:UDP-N-acetylglucosamine--N-acetylmuramyl-(pentapeptide) pyrophosphoryl-undecaprenol N-acetylglucosamine transferase [Patescibacteria group bacterium]MCL5261771.1 UDP-N-acetylglucosamine--N-acetylmuramyl-(pentapeptide) pyrophosphoryl-undecaprenol N-acetylglucosamine transferase [Patescibacteria group bacterium]